MEGEYHFDSTPIAPPGSEMLMHEKPGKRRSFGINAKKAWYLGPCLKHYCTFRGILPSTGAERLSNTVRIQHHAIAILDLTPADRILEAARQLDHATKQQPKRAPMEEITAIELLREVLLGEKKTAILPNSVQLRKAKQKQLPSHQSPSTPPKPATNANYVPDDDADALSDLDGNYSDSDDDDEVEDTAIHPRARRSKRVMQQCDK